MTESPIRPAPKRLADFEIIRRLGAGGMAEVFLAKKRGAEGTFKLLVLKRILPAYGSSRRFRTMFAEEAQLATRLNHPNIVQVYDFQDYGDEGQLLSMEYVEGPDLRKLMRSAQAKGQRIPPYVAAYIIAEVAKGLHYAHERKDEAGKPIDIVHRDVSPQNILMSFDGGVKIADFGIASANLFREEPGVLKGKTAYMSPEQARGERVSRRTDIYSLGVVFHELLTARPLHGAAEGQELLEAVRAGVVEPPSTYVRELPAELEEVVMRALAKNPDQRFQTARDMAAAVSRALFQKHQLVDSHVLETVLAELATREHTSPGVELGSNLPSEAAHGSEAPDDLSSVAHVKGTAAGQVDEESTGPGRALRGRVGREVRHVAVVTLRLHGFDKLSISVARPQALRVLELLKSTLGEVAFRRGARFAWHMPLADTHNGESFPTAARALVGLMANPTRAPLDALWLAIDVHEVIRGASEDLPVGLSASVGIVRGIAAGERDRAGHLIQHALQAPASHLADLLADNAPPGVSWVAGGLYRLVRREFVWGDAPTIKIQESERLNLPQDMRIYSLLRPHTRQEKLDEMALAPNDLIGRDAELADLLAACYSAVGAALSPGQVSARVVYGEMGIGKTALLAAFLNALPPDARVLRVESSPALSEVPFATISEWIRELTGTRVDQPFEQARNQIASALGEFGGEQEGPEVVLRMAELATGRVRQTVDDADVAETRQLIGLGMRRFFARAAMDAPLVVALDGLQWTDRPSLDLISDFLRRSEPLSVLVILLSRPEDRVSAYIEGLVRIELKGLSAEHQLRLLQTRLGVTQGVRQVCADLLPRAGGNPFFLLEMVDALLERGLLEIRERDGQQELVQLERLGDASFALPSTLEQLIADRLNELPPAEQAVIEWLAVAGGPLGIVDLRTISGEDPAEAVTRLSARGLCEVKVDIIDVRHPLTRDVAYRALDRRRRVRMHRRLGEHLANSPLGKGLTAAIVARHLARGNARAEAARFYLEAADAARANYQTQLAKRCYRRVIALVPSGDMRLLEAHEALESICRNQGRWRERRTHLGALRALARTAKSAQWAAITLLRTAQFELDAGQLAKALVSARRGEALAAQANSPVLEVQARTLMAEIMHDVGDMQGALSAVGRALATAEGSGVPARLRAEALRLQGTLLRRVGRVHEAVEAQAEAIAVFRLAGVRRMEARAKNSLAYALLVLGRFEDGIALALDAIRIDLAIGGRFQIAKTLSTIGECYASLGDLERGLAYLRRARDAHERYGDRDSRADTLLSTAEILIEFGDVDGAETLVGDAGALTAVTGSAFDSVHEKILRAILARVHGDHARAVMYAFEARQAAEAQAYVAYHFYAMAIEARARVDMGEEHTGILLATTALGAIDTLQGSEYGLPTRALGCETLRVARSPQAEEMRERAARYASSLLENIRDPLFRRSFVQRPVVQAVLTKPEPQLHAPRGVDNPLTPP